MYFSKHFNQLNVHNYIGGRKAFLKLFDVENYMYRNCHYMLRYESFVFSFQYDRHWYLVTGKLS